jgi:pseudouridine-5'-phosphate glycosidase
VFVTGGIGGVHRFSEETMGKGGASLGKYMVWTGADITRSERADISTDLLELSRTPVAVICAGIKSILDIPRTLEFLETHVHLLT